MEKDAILDLNIILNKENKTSQNELSFAFLRIEKCRFLSMLQTFKIAHRKCIKIRRQPNSEFWGLHSTFYVLNFKRL